jgi:hypothetical protein
MRKVPIIPSFSKRAAISELTLHHELEVLDVKVAFHEAVRGQKTLSLAEFSTWPRLYEFSARDDDSRWSGVKTVKPDGYTSIHEKEADGSMREHLLFLEIDRGTEKLDILVQKRSATRNSTVRAAWLCDLEKLPRSTRISHSECPSSAKARNGATILRRCLWTCITLFSPKSVSPR